MSAPPIRQVVARNRCRRPASGPVSATGPDRTDTDEQPSALDLARRAQPRACRPPAEHRPRGEATTRKSRDAPLALPGSPLTPTRGTIDSGSRVRGDGARGHSPGGLRALVRNLPVACITQHVFGARAVGGCAVIRCCLTPVWGSPADRRGSMTKHRGSRMSFSVRGAVGRAVAAVAAGAVLAASGAVTESANAAAQPAAASPVSAAVAGSTGASADLTAPDMASARLTARLRGVPVLVEDATTATTQLWANPDGTTSLQASAGPGTGAAGGRLMAWGRHAAAAHG